MAKNFHVWIDIYLVQTPDTTTTMLRWSQRPIADASTYAGGFKEGRIALDGWGPITRAASDRNGEYQIGTMVVRADDTDNAIRAYLNDFATQFWLNRHAVVRLVSDVGRLTETPPRTLWRARMRQPQLRTGLGVDIPCEDLLGSQISALNLDKQLPTRVITREDFPQAPPEVIGLPVPFGYGEVSDNGAVDADGNNVAKGMIPALYVGPKIITSTGAPTPPELTRGSMLLPPPPAPTFVRYGSGGNTTWTYAVSALTATGQTTLGAPVTITDLPSDGNFTGGETDWRAVPTNGVSLHLALYPAEQQTQVVGLRLWVKLGAADSTNRWCYVDGAGNMFNSTANEYFAGPAGYMDNGDDSHHKTTHQVPTSNTATISVTFTTGGGGPTVVATAWDMYLIAGHAWTPLGVFGSNMDPDDPKRVQLGEEHLGDDILIPGYGLDAFEDINGHRYGLMYAKGPISDMAKDGRITFAVNACLQHEFADQTGLLIDQAYYVYQHLLVNWILSNEGQGYQTGDWAPIPEWPGEPGVPMVQTTTFEACQTITKARLANAMGYLSAFHVNQFTTVRDILRQLNLSYDGYIYPNAHGQIAVGMIDDIASPTAGTLYREIVDLVSLEAPEIRDDETENIVEFAFDFDPDAGEYRSLSVELKDAEAIRAAKAPLRFEKYEYFCLRDEPTALDVAAHRLRRYKIPPVYYTSVHNLGGLDIELFDQIRVTGREGLGPEGAVAVPVVPLEHVVDPNTGTVTVRGLDVSRILMSTFAPAGLGDETIEGEEDDVLRDETILTGPGAAMELVSDG